MDVAFKRSLKLKMYTVNAIFIENVIRVLTC
jgi:hypothetical protein